MGKTFRPYDMSQQFLLPPDLRQWLEEGHLALFVSDVVEELNLSAIMKSYEEGDGRGRPPYHPLMMVKLLVYGYCIGKMSSRKIEHATYDDIAFRVLACNQHPDHDSIAEFRKRHLNELANLFVQVLTLCQRAGLVKLGRVAIDGSKFKANAYKYKTKRYWRLNEEEAKLQAEVQRLLKQAQEVDEAEDKSCGKGKRGDDLPEELRRRETRLARIREAKRSLEDEAKQRYEKKVKEVEEKLEQRRKAEEETGKKAKGREPKLPDPKDALPSNSASRNLTDLDSRIMKDGATKSFQQCYNGQLAVDSETQIIVGAKIVQTTNDQQQLVPMLEEVAKNCGSKPDAAMADAGYFSSAAVTAQAVEGITLYVPPNQRRPEKDPIIGVVGPNAKVSDKMWHRLMSEEGKTIYKSRGAIVEPVFGQIKQVRGFRQFLLRGLEKVSGEWLLICATHNLLKLFRATVGTQSQPERWLATVAR
jgi:transposase